MKGWTGDDGEAGSGEETGSTLPEEGDTLGDTDDSEIPDDGGGHCMEPDETDSATDSTDRAGSTETRDPAEPTDSDERPSTDPETQTGDEKPGSDTGGDPFGETEADTVIERKTDTETGGALRDTANDTATASEGDSLTEVDSQTATDSGAPSVPVCDTDMVLVPANPDRGIGSPFCMDRYEASRQDATAESAGSDGAVATSRPGVIPWFVNPMSADGLTLFQNACQAVGKRLCSSEEWGYGCTGPDALNYSFGNIFDVEICNSVDTYCDDYCLAEGIPEEDCNTDENCGYQCGLLGSGVSCFHVDPTGSYGRCINPFGAFDVNGNVWEVVPSDTDSRGYEVRGGAFNCAYPGTRFGCGYNAGWTALYAGFRCCKAPSWV